jgi:hypothetical protein
VLFVPEAIPGLERPRHAVGGVATRFASNDTLLGMLPIQIIWESNQWMVTDKLVLVPSGGGSGPPTGIYPWQ